MLSAHRILNEDLSYGPHIAPPGRPPDRLAARWAARRPNGPQCRRGSRMLSPTGNHDGNAPGGEPGALGVARTRSSGAGQPFTAPADSPAT